MLLDIWSSDGFWAPVSQMFDFIIIIALPMNYSSWFTVLRRKRILQAFGFVSLKSLLLMLYVHDNYDVIARWRNSPLLYEFQEFLEFLSKAAAGWKVEKEI